ncbi:MAG: GNAT family N-acetyltransferase [Rhodoluna sp.]|nr:GNAT family N-acetyltransferase [Rhodoluna sp.]
MNTEVIHNESLQRYEILLEGEKVGHADYKVDGNVLVFDHTEVDPAQQGKNLAGILMRAALDDVRERGLMMRPVCSYVVKFVERYDEYADLVA